MRIYMEKVAVGLIILVFISLGLAFCYVAGSILWDIGVFISKD